MKLFDPGGQGQRSFVFLLIALLVVNCGHGWYISGTFSSASRVSIRYSCVLSSTVGLKSNSSPGLRETQVCSWALSKRIEALSKFHVNMQYTQVQDGVLRGVPNYSKVWVPALSTSDYLGSSLSEPHVPSVK